MYAVVAVGGNQHRVEEGSTLLVDRLGEKQGAKVALTPVMFRGDDVVVDADGLKKVKIEAVVQGHERGEKIRVFKFKPKRGYKRNTGHRQELTRLEVTKISFGGAAAKPKAQPRRSEAPATKAEAKVDTKPKAEAGREEACGREGRGQEAGSEGEASSEG